MFKVIIVTKNGDQLEKLLNAGWTVVQSLGTQTTGIVIILQKSK